jgi:hypothetical protein
MAEQEEERYNDKTCMYPGCDKPAVDSKPRGFGEGYKANYCELDEHNAASMFQALNKNEESESETPA